MQTTTMKNWIEDHVKPMVPKSAHVVVDELIEMVQEVDRLRVKAGDLQAETPCGMSIEELQTEYTNGVERERWLNQQCVAVIAELSDERQKHAQTQEELKKAIEAVSAKSEPVTTVTEGFRDSQGLALMRIMRQGLYHESTLMGDQTSRISWIINIQKQIAKLNEVVLDQIEENGIEGQISDGAYSETMERSAICAANIIDFMRYMMLNKDRLTRKEDE